MLATSQALPKPTPRSLTCGTLPAFIDDQHPPYKRQPFGTVLNQQCLHSINLILPTSMAEGVMKEAGKIDLKKPNWPPGCVRYAKVILALSDIVEEQFLTRYIKTGNAIMMSEGRKGVDKRYELLDGTLAIELDRATYERVGLAGKVIMDGGQKHKKNRYRIEIDLRQPSMLHGKKGFERVAWAFRNVLLDAVTWVFVDLSAGSNDDAPAPIERHHPRWLTAQPSLSLHQKSRAPHFLVDLPEDLTARVLEDGDLAADLEEWISMVSLSSPRIEAHDHPDPFVCRYTTPSINTPGGPGYALLEDAKTIDLSQITWSGFLPAAFAHRILLAVTKTVRTPGWWCMRSSGLREGGTVTMLRVLAEKSDQAKYICWQEVT